MSIEKDTTIENPWKNKQRTGNIGLYYAAYKLSWLNWNTLITHRNSKGADIIVYKDNSDNYKSVQVKTMTGKHYVHVGKSATRELEEQPIIISDVWIFILLSRKADITTEQPVCYVVSQKDVINYTECDINPGKDGKYSWWVNPKKFFDDIHKEKWEIFI